MFLLQISQTFQDIVFFADRHELIVKDLDYYWDVRLDLSWANVRHSSEWLAGVEATRTWVNGTMDFRPGCQVVKGWYDELLPVCNAWYLLLVGELRLRAGPDFTIHTLMRCLFALSGSVILLIMR
ncbi:hypothetical protein AAVH_30904 [Aphelenchoides avenae]|nr:hypothetical protein AAVH_30904 [Aphelenchus avenae]